MKCPTCGEDMELGHLAFYEPLIISRIVWQLDSPGYFRIRQPKDAVTVIEPPFLGKGD